MQAGRQGGTAVCVLSAAPPRGRQWTQHSNADRSPPPPALRGEQSDKTIFAEARGRRPNDDALYAGSTARGTGSSPLGVGKEWGRAAAARRQGKGGSQRRLVYEMQSAGSLAQGGKPARHSAAQPGTARQSGSAAAATAMQNNGAIQRDADRPSIPLQGASRSSPRRLPQARRVGPGSSFIFLFFAFSCLLCSLGPINSDASLRVATRCSHGPPP